MKAGLGFGVSSHAFPFFGRGWVGHLFFAVYQQIEHGAVAKDAEPGQIKLFARHTGTRPPAPARKGSLARSQGLPRPLAKAPSPDRKGSLARSQGLLARSQ